MSTPAGRDTRVKLLDFDTGRRGREGVSDQVCRLIFPLVTRLAPEVGDDVNHVSFATREHAARLLSRLDRLDVDSPMAVQFIDEICEDVHLTIVEIERGALPLLHQALADEYLVVAEVSELVGAPTRRQVYLGRR